MCWAIGIVFLILFVSFLVGMAFALSASIADEEAQREWNKLIKEMHDEK